MRLLLLGVTAARAGALTAGTPGMCRWPVCGVTMAWLRQDRQAPGVSHAAWWDVSIQGLVGSDACAGSDAWGMAEHTPA